MFCFFKIKHVVKSKQSAPNLEGFERWLPQILRGFRDGVSTFGESPKY